MCAVHTSLTSQKINNYDPLRIPGIQIGVIIVFVAHTLCTQLSYAYKKLNKLCLYLYTVSTN